MKKSGQIDFLDEMIVDNFAGGGGASTGIELATGRAVEIAINHDPDAILMHMTNHPYTEHLQVDVWDVDPTEVCKGRKVGLAWFSPDCKHFSKAKGSKPVEKKIRGLAWITLRWAGKVRPRVIILENVEEFKTWGPVRKGKPVKSKAGQTFKKFIAQLEALGYVVEYGELIAADYGVPTIRKRFVLVARCDGMPIVWPEPTHGIGRSKPWRAAAEIIDWTIPCPSIFASKAEIKLKYNLAAVRPLADNTLQRVARGIDKFTIKSGKPFIVEVNHGGGFRGQDPAEPLNTVTGKHGYGIVTPSLLSIGQTGGGDRIRSITEPIATQVSKAESCLVATNLIQYHQEQAESVRGQQVTDPIMTLDGSNRYALSAAHLTEYFGTGNPLDIHAPLHTVTAKDREALVLSHIQKYYSGGYTGCGSDTENPIGTITPYDHNAICLSHVVKFKGTNLGQPITDPLQTITVAAEFAVANTVIVKYSGQQDLCNWPKVRGLLNKYCGYNMRDEDVLLLYLCGSWWFISDVGLRMLVPKELYAAMGFPDDYIIDRDYRGNVYGKAKQVARCGNAVCPPIAEAVVRANLPEWCAEKIDTMSQLMKKVAASD